jgi:hypothetical protein
MCVLSAELCVRAAAACTGGRRPHPFPTCAAVPESAEPGTRGSVAAPSRRYDNRARAHTKHKHGTQCYGPGNQHAKGLIPIPALRSPSRPGPAVSTRMRSRAAAAPRTTTSVHTARMSRAARMGYAHSALGLLAFFSTAGVGAAGSTGVMSSTGPFFCSAASLALPHWVASRICSWEMPFFVIWVR